MIQSLFEGEQVRLAFFDPERDAPVEASWTADPEFARLLIPGPARLLGPGHFKKLHEAWAEDKKHYMFALRLRSDSRLLGFVQLRICDWNQGVAKLALGIGNPADRGHGYGTQALSLILRYAFIEVNLRRVSGSAPEYNTGAARFVERAGFVLETRRREAVYHAGRRWDHLEWGLLRQEWKGAQTQ